MMKLIPRMQMVLWLILFAMLFTPFMALGADHLVDHSENIPCVLWTRGCTPTSASMVLGYWDRGDSGWEWYGMGKLHDYWREYSKYSDGTGPIRNVPNVLEELRIEMGTSVGGTTPWDNIGPGIEAVCNSRNGYSFDSAKTGCGNSNDWCWSKITGEIGNNRPFVWSPATPSVGHSLAAWGYTDAKYVITYNTWNCPGRDDWYYKKYDNGAYSTYVQVDTVVPGGWTWGQTSLTTPNGGETWTAGRIYTIWWYETDDRTWSADLYYSVNGGVSWTFFAKVEPSGPGWKSYNWTVPASLSATSKARIRIKNHSGSSSHWVYQAGDGSQANFTIVRDQTAPSPNPMTWDSVPYEVSGSEIRMWATTASDSFAPVEYFFDFYSGGCGGGTDSGWQTSRYYADTGLEPNCYYYYRVKARDGSPDHNQTSYSVLSYDYTDIEMPTGITFGTVSTNSIAVRSTNTPSNLAWGSSGLWFECKLMQNSGWKRNNDYWTQTGLAVNTRYYFRAKARNGDGAETSFCAWGNRYTLANTPNTPAVGNMTLTTIDVSVRANGNPDYTEYEIGYWYNGTWYYLDASGARSTIPVWQTIAAWGTVTVSGLEPGTSYCFYVRARNGNGVITAWSPAGCASTHKRTIAVTSPNGGERWYIGNLRTIAWISKYLTGNVKIEISRDNGAGWSTIVSSTSNDGTYQWTLTGPTSSRCIVRITSIGYPAVGDVSNASFIIASAAKPCLADLNDDGNVDRVDLAILADAYGSLAGAPHYNPNAEIKKDNCIEGQDLVILIREFGRDDCP